jgi:hypothetical protein
MNRAKGGKKESVSKPADGKEGARFRKS